MASKKQNANVLYNQLSAIEEGWNQRKKENNVVFHAELSQYNSLIENSGRDLNDAVICRYKVSDDCLSTSSVGNKYVYSTDPLFQITCLKKHLEVTYKILASETSFIKDRALRDKYSLYLSDRKKYSAGDTLLSVTLEFEDRLRRRASLSSESTGTDLANQALNPTTGALVLRDMSKKEVEGYYNLVKGFFGFVRGKTHHVKSEIGREALFKEVILVDKLLDQFDNLVNSK